jgi:hypothetical protein
MLLANCCPGLERLCIAGLVEEGVDLSPLLQLTALTGLSVGGGVTADYYDLHLGGGVIGVDAVNSIIARMTGLRQLDIIKPSVGMSDQGLLHLTALTRLTALRVVNYSAMTGISSNVDDEPLGEVSNAGVHLLQSKVRWVAHMLLTTLS